MSEGKDDTYISPVTSPITQYVCADIATSIAYYLPIKDLSHLTTLAKSFNFFKADLDKRAASVYVVEGNVILLKKLITTAPSLLFEKQREITAPRGQKYFDLSPYQLMIFLCDDDMKSQIMPLIPEKFNKIIQLQYEEINCGGVDLLKLDRDPPKIIDEQGFKGLTQYKTAFTLYDEIVGEYFNTQEVTFPLLENPDGIICYQDENEDQHFYYVHQEKEIIEQLDTCLIEAEFKKFTKTFARMENNSGRRSSVKEHQLIEKLFGHALVQKGILYEHKGIQYRDYRTPFNLVNAYRKCLRLYQEAEENGNLSWASMCWCGKVGQAQGEEVWLLQSICDETNPFYSLERSCRIYNVGEYESVFENGIVNISDFAVYKGHATYEATADVAFDALLFVCKLIENAKANLGTDWDRPQDPILNI